MTHNFIKDANRVSNFPGKIYWSCKNCDSGVLIPKGYTVHQVNQFMESKMPCLPPVIKPIDDIIDDRTTIKKQNGIIVPSRKN